MKKESIIKFFNSLGGFARMGELKAASFSNRDISGLVEDGVLEKIKSGLYRLTEMNRSSEENMEMGDICRAYPKAVICLASALSYYELTTFNPQEVFVAVPRNSCIPRIIYPPLKTFFYNERYYGWGITTIMREFGEIRMYDREKTICDTFRYRNKLGEDLALEALRTYLNNGRPNIGKLIEYATKSHTKTVMMPYLRALVE